MKIGLFALLLLLTVTAESPGQAPVWYLLRPPKVEKGPDRPLVEWRIEAAYDSAAMCQKAGQMPAEIWALMLQRERELPERRDKELAARRALHATEGGTLLFEALRSWVRVREEVARTTPAGLSSLFAPLLALYGVVDFPEERLPEYHESNLRLQELRQQMERWPVAAKALAAWYEAVMQVEIVTDALIGLQQLVYKCLPSEALPPGMLPLK